jgi:hypothetical protein
MGRTDRAAPIHAGIADWLREFLREAEVENELLERNGAEPSAKARRELIRKLLEAQHRWLDQELTVNEVARDRNRHPETVRRALRGKGLPGRKESEQGEYRVRRGDALALLPRKPGDYDAVADAQGIANRKRRS